MSGYKDRGPAAEMRVLITGGSGFIGTNLVEFYLKRGTPIINVDVLGPRNPAHAQCWVEVDIRNVGALKSKLRVFSPTHVIHLAARTDLRGHTLADYDANISGVASVVEAVNTCRTVERVVYASSMLVCATGYKPKAEDDYSPSTLYGESKIIGEKLVRTVASGNPGCVIVRPSSIWGQWFGEPYRGFFQSVLNGWFVKFGSTKALKTFGYVGNTAYQVDALLHAPEASVRGRTLYLGDRPPLTAEEWADEIARQAGVRRPRTAPVRLVRAAAKVGDALARIGLSAPMTSFRLANITTHNEVDLDDIYSIAGAPPYSLEEGVCMTLDWLGYPTSAQT